ncbi:MULTISPECIES: ribosome silencing factor [Larsenimonas]|uniref:Ribosomal silencing factor RsfS n=1 Tax=Larsenimonas suaedae TaxID=1851019 RepID=A0ABU1GWM8_9GAMM|nr:MULTISPECIES: ribosome silencing factor [Larsenimonas]MCM2971247.1 ribosome silencing factor [Larsenimonas suaedae]MCM5703354.1 ribosome silencing factor [Larsenimonas salina]MDR5895956.1 ribosome silencing factor [Larsenimonas suaedae]
MQTEALKTLVVNALEDTKAQDVVTMDVAKLTSVTDVMVVASGTSSRHISALANGVVKDVKEQGIQPIGVEGKQGSEWVLVDLGDVVVHIMTPATRELYDLERLWSDLPTDLERDGKARS